MEGEARITKTLLLFFFLRANSTIACFSPFFAIVSRSYLCRIWLSTQTDTPVFLCMLTLILSENWTAALRALRPQGEGEFCTDRATQLTWLSWTQSLIDYPASGWQRNRNCMRTISWRECTISWYQFLLIICTLRIQFSFHDIKVI